MSRPERLTPAGPAEPDLSPENWLLAILRAGGPTPNSGESSLEKYVFVVGKEVLPQIDQKFQFFPGKFGPHSTVFDSAIRMLLERRQLEEVDFLEGTGTGEFAQPDLHLTPDGENAADSVISALPPGLANALGQLKFALSRLGPMGILQYVLSAYPQYAHRPAQGSGLLA